VLMWMLRRGEWMALSAEERYEPDLGTACTLRKSTIRKPWLCRSFLLVSSVEHSTFNFGLTSSLTRVRAPTFNVLARSLQVAPAIDFLYHQHALCATILHNSSQLSLKGVRSLFCRCRLLSGFCFLRTILQASVFSALFANSSRASPRP
jgi:urea transporter